MSNYYPICITSEICIHTPICHSKIKNTNQYSKHLNAIFFISDLMKSESLDRINPQQSCQQIGQRRLQVGWHFKMSTPNCLVKAINVVTLERVPPRAHVEQTHPTPPHVHLKIKIFNIIKKFIISSTLNPEKVSAPLAISGG